MDCLAGSFKVYDTCDNLSLYLDAASAKITLVNVYVDLLVFTRIAGIS